MLTTAATRLARQLISRELHGETSDDATVLAAERICVLVTGGLSRWFGQYGSHALVTRALASVQGRHPVLRRVTVTEAHQVSGLADTVSAHGADATIEGIIAMVAALADLIGRLIGDDLAMLLLEQSTTVPATEQSSVPAEPRTDADTKRSGTP
jgi:hypothetical protein